MSDAQNATGLEGWKVADDGYLELHPLVSYASGTSPEGCILRLEYSTSKEKWKDGEFEALQLHLKPEQARALSQTLAGIAERIEQGLGGVPNNSQPPGSELFGQSGFSAAR